MYHKDDNPQDIDLPHLGEEKLVNVRVHEILHRFGDEIAIQNLKVESLSSFFENWIDSTMVFHPNNVINAGISEKNRNEAVEFFNTTFIPKYTELKDFNELGAEHPFGEYGIMGAITNANNQAYEKKKRTHTLYAKGTANGMKEHVNDGLIDEILREEKWDNLRVVVCKVKRAVSYETCGDYNVLKAINPSKCISFPENRLIRDEIDGYGVWQNKNLTWGGKPKEIWQPYLDS